jgi:hypothetical protein
MSKPREGFLYYTLVRTLLKASFIYFLSSCSTKAIFSIKDLSKEFTSLNNSSALNRSVSDTPRAVAILTTEEKAGADLR